METPAENVEGRLSELQTQLDQLSAATSPAPEPPDGLDSVRTLGELTERCNEILDRWSATDARHQQAVGELEARLTGWSALEGRLQQESRQRMTEIEQTIEREWQVLRQPQAPVDPGVQKTVK